MLAFPFEKPAIFSKETEYIELYNSSVLEVEQITIDESQN